VTSIKLQQTSEDRDAWAFCFGERGPGQLVFGRVGGLVQSGERIRTLSVPAISIPSLLTAGVLSGAISNIDELFANLGMQIHVGDYFVNTACDGTTPAGWRCVGAGTIGTLQSGITGRVNSTNFEFNAAAEGVFRPGDTVQLGNRIGTLEAGRGESPDTGGPTWYTDKFHSEQGGIFPATYAAPRMRAVGEGVGPLARRPTLRPDDAGWRYFDTDSNTWSTWSGTAWV